MTSADDDRRNDDLCAACGGMCCLIYFAHDEEGEFIGEGWLAREIEQWLARFRASGALPASADEYGVGPAGVEPLHDPRLSSLPTAEGIAYRASLPPDVDPRRCQFCGDEGCLLPRSHRAPLCNSWVCDLWVDAPSDAPSGRTEAPAGDADAIGGAL